MQEHIENFPVTEMISCADFISFEHTATLLSSYWSEHNCLNNQN